ncbi:Vps62-related protein [Candidatus Uabimicrobium amorphum]
MKNLWVFFLVLPLCFAQDVSQLKRVPGKLIQISSGKTAWGVNENNKVFCWYNSYWQKMPGSFTQVATGRDGTVCALGTDNRVHIWRNKYYAWELLSDEEVTFIAVGGKKHIWAISKSNSALEWDASQNMWIEYPIAVNSISVGSDGFVWASAIQEGSLFLQDGAWQQIRADFREIIVDDGRNLWALDEENGVFRLQNGSWIQIFPPALECLSVANGKAWGISSSGEIYRFRSPVFMAESDESITPIEQTPWTWEELNEVANRYLPYLHMCTEDPFHPSSVAWLLDRVSLVKKQNNTETTVAQPPYTKEELAKITKVQKGALYYPQINGTDAKSGDISSAKIYVNAKRMNSFQDYTDIQYWFFYPYNGSGTLTIFGEIVPVSLFGAHQGDWEHITVRVHNTTRKVKAVYFSQHAGGEWIFDLNKITWRDGRPVVFSSKHGHASYPKVGLNKQAFLDVGLVNKTNRGPLLDASGRMEIIGVWNELQAHVVEPEWLDFPYDWGAPRPPYSKELLYESFPQVPKWSIDLVAPILKEVWTKIVSGGPSGPKQKGSWSGAE